MTPLLDTVHSVETPEGVDLALHVVGPVARAYAWFMDALLQVALLYAGGLVLSWLGTAGIGLWLLVYFAISWFYPVVFEVLAAGQTPGKRVMGLRVVHEDGTPVALGASVLRNFLRTVDFMPALYLLGLTSMLIDRSFRRLGDLAAGTIVVYTEPDAGPVAPGGDPVATPLAPPVALDPEEERAVIAFAERAPLLTPERAAELAAIAVPLVGDASAPDGTEQGERLARMAAWLLGRRP